VALPTAVETVTVNFGPFPDYQGEFLDGDCYFTPITPGNVLLVHVPSGTPLVKRPIKVSFSKQEGSTGNVVLPATDGADLNVSGFTYSVQIVFKSSQGAENPKTKLIQLPAAVPVVDLDILPEQTSASGIVVATPAVLSVAGLSGVVSVADLASALDASGASDEEIAALSADITLLKTSKATASSVTALSGRVGTVESDVDALDVAVAGRATPAQVTAAVAGLETQAHATATSDALDARLNVLEQAAGSASLVDHGDGTFDLSGSSVTDNGDGTYTIAA